MRSHPRRLVPAVLLMLACAPLAAQTLPNSTAFNSTAVASPQQQVHGGAGRLDGGRRAADPEHLQRPPGAGAALPAGRRPAAGDDRADVGQPVPHGARRRHHQRHRGRAGGLHHGRRPALPARGPGHRHQLSPAPPVVRPAAWKSAAVRTTTAPWCACGTASSRPPAATRTGASAAPPAPASPPACRCPPTRPRPRGSCSRRPTAPPAAKSAASPRSATGLDRRPVHPPGLAAPGAAPGPADRAGPALHHAERPRLRVRLRLQPHAPRRLDPDRGRRQRPAAPARGLRAEPVLRHLRRQRQRRLLAPGRQRLLRHAGGERLRQPPRAARGSGAAPADGPLPGHAAEREGQPQPQHRARRELRPRSDAAVLHRPGRTQPRRHAQARRRRQHHPHLQQRSDHQLRPRPHRLELRRRGQLVGVGGRRQAARPDPPDDAVGDLPRHRRQDAVPGHVPGRGPHRRSRPEVGARRPGQPSQRRAVPGQAPDPAPGHQQPVARLRAPRRHRLQQQRRRRARRHARRGQGDPARQRGAQHDAGRPRRVRQGQGADAPAHRDLARLRRPGPVGGRHRGPDQPRPAAQPRRRRATWARR